MVHKNRHCTEAFLISEAAPAVREEAAKTDPASGPGELSPSLPDVLTGRVFLEKCMEAVDALHAFGALAIRLDRAENAPGGESLEEREKALAAVARTIERICKKSDAPWGLLDSGDFCICLPEAGSAQCREIAEGVRHSVKRGGRGAVSIGIAVHPVGDFTKIEIFDNIIKALDHAEFFGPGSMVEFDAVSLNISGDKRYHIKDLEGAVREYERALLLDSGNVNVHNSLGVCFAVLGWFDKALDRFDMASQLDPSEVMPLYNAGLAYFMMGQNEKALEMLLKASRVEEGVFEVLLQTGKVLMTLGRKTEALDCLGRAAAAQPDAWAGHKNLGDCLAALDKPAKAAKAYEKAVKLNPNDAESLSSLALAYSQMGENLDVAAAFAQQSVSLAPENGLFRFRLAGLYEKREEFPKAVVHYEKALALGHPCAAHLIAAREKQRNNLG